MPSTNARDRYIRRRARRAFGTPDNVCLAIHSKWAPAALSRVDTIILTGVMALMALVRGADYAFGDGPDTAATMQAVEAQWPIQVWSAGFITGGALLAVGLLSRRHGVVWLGHAILCVFYAALGAGMFQTAAFLWGGDGLRYAGAILLPSSLHLLLALRTGPRPIIRGKLKAAVVTSS